MRAAVEPVDPARQRAVGLELAQLCGDDRLHGAGIVSADQQRAVRPRIHSADFMLLGAGNIRGKRFEEVTLPGGFGHIQKGHATAFADLDRDGDEDVYMILGGAYEGDQFTSVLFENPGWPKNHWIMSCGIGK